MTKRAKNPVKSTETTFAVVEGLRELDGAGVSELADHLDLRGGHPLSRTGRVRAQPE